MSKKVNFPRYCMHLVNGVVAKAIATIRDAEIRVYEGFIEEEANSRS